MIDPDAFAALICDWSLDVQPGQQIAIQTTTAAEAPAAALYRAILDRDAWPILDIKTSTMWADLYGHGRDRHFDGFAPAVMLQAQSVDAWVRIDAPTNLNELTGVDPELPRRFARSMVPVREVILEHHWTGTIWPTSALAQQAKMADRAYAEFVRRALFLDRDDPIAAWRALSEGQGALVEQLEHGHEVRIESDRTDLRLRIDDRRWVNSDGRRNMPSGEVFTGPLESSAQGTIRFDVPSVHDGAEVVGVELTFRDGEVTNARAELGDPQLQAALMSDRGARFIGELGIGTNVGIDRATGSTLLDEKMAGTIHLALGRSYPETGGLNQSALHWDLICDLRTGGRVTIDGEILIENGKLLG